MSGENWGGGKGRFGVGLKLDVRLGLEGYLVVL